jgi:hypothetical protein
VTEDATSDETLDPRPARVNPGVGAMLGLAVALLLAMLPGGGLSANRLPAGLAAAAADQSILGAASRVVETRASVSKVRGPRVREDFGDAPMLPAAALALSLVLFGAILLRPPFARAPAPARRHSTTRARAPPRA